MSRAINLQPRTFFLALLLGIIWPLATQARTTRLDDSASVAIEPTVAMRWESPTPGTQGTAAQLIGSTTVRIRINVTAWLQRPARIFLVMPPQLAGPLECTWSTQGILMSGQLQGSGRALVFNGPISGPVLEDVVNFRFRIPASAMSLAAQTVNFYFELDED
jgi:hypothetical protein